MPAEASSETLRARYYDWCSAKIVERIFQLSPEEVWYRAAQVQDAPEPVGASEDSEAFVSRNVVELVRSLADQVARELALPPFEEWAEAYRTDPAHFEREIVVLERSSPNSPSPGRSEAIT